MILVFWKGNGNFFFLEKKHFVAYCGFQIGSNANLYILHKKFLSTHTDDHRARI